MQIALRTIAIVIGVIALRLMFMPSPPLLLRRFARKWGKRTTMLIGMCSLLAAAALILIAGR